MAPQLDIDAGFRRREWRLERVGWVLLALVLFASLAGAGGAGVVSWSQVQSPRGLLTVEYERVEHRQADATVTVRLRVAESGQVALRVGGAWFAAVDLRGVVPEPEQQIATADGVVLLVRVQGPAEVSVDVSVRVIQAGLLTGEIGYGDESVTFRQLVLA